MPINPVDTNVNLKYLKSISYKPMLNPINTIVNLKVLKIYILQAYVVKQRQ